MVNDITTGASYLLRGYRLITAPGVRRFVVLPFVINLLVVGLILWFGMDRFGVLIEWMLPSGDAWWITAARTVLWLLFTITAVLILIITFTLLANLIGAPFNGLLSEHVERHLRGGAFPSEEDGAGTGMMRIIVSLLHELRKLLSFLLLAGSLLLLSVIPIVNLAVPVMWTLAAGWMLALEYLAYPMENHGIRLGLTRNHPEGRRLMMLGFGLAVLAASAVPLVNLLIMPAAVAGATALWIDNQTGP